MWHQIQQVLKKIGITGFTSLEELEEFLKYNAEPHEEKILKKALSDIEGFSE